MRGVKGTAPTHGWLISNRILRYLAWAFMVFLLVTFVSVWTITYTIRRNCQEPYHRDVKVFGYWLHIESGSTQKGCPGP